MVCTHSTFIFVIVFTYIFVLYLKGSDLNQCEIIIIIILFVLGCSLHYVTREKG
jgi:hypothetical protein